MKIELFNVNEWAGIDDKQLIHLLNVTYNAFSLMVGKDLKKDIVVTNNKYPTPQIDHFTNNKEPYKIDLTIPDCFDWCKIIFQFSHEICHAYCNFNDAQKHRQKWFEEVICDAASFSNLYNISKNWNLLKVKDGLPTWCHQSYIKEYIEILFSQYNTATGLSGTQINKHIDINLANLEANSLQRKWLRDVNRVVSIYLCENIFYKSPPSWKACIYLNRWPVPYNGSFEEFIDSWKTLGDRHVSKIIQALELT